MDLLLELRRCPSDIRGIAIRFFSSLGRFVRSRPGHSLTDLPKPGIDERLPDVDAVFLERFQLRT